MSMTFNYELDLVEEAFHPPKKNPSEYTGKCIHIMLQLTVFSVPLDRAYILYNTMVSLLFVGINFCGFIENHSFKYTYMCGQ